MCVFFCFVVVVFFNVGLTQFENEDDDDDSGSLFKLPNFGRKPPKPPGRRPLNPKVSPWDFSNSSEDASLLVAEPPDISTYNPGRWALTRIHPS